MEPNTSCYNGNSACMLSVLDKTSAKKEDRACPLVYKGAFDAVPRASFHWEHMCSDMLFLHLQLLG